MSVSPKMKLARTLLSNDEKRRNVPPFHGKIWTLNKKAREQKEDRIIAKAEARRKLVSKKS